MKLKTEQNTPQVERAIRSAARAVLGRRRLGADFEHRQWWVTDLDTGAQFAVVETEDVA